jgi:proton-dependent oligopeptide transporter, POT family
MADGFPRQIPYIIGNEAAERFSFYGMRNILTLFVTGYLLRNAPPEIQKEGDLVLHWFVMGVYFFPLLGGYVADRFWGKYRTILWLSILYAIGQASLPVFVDNRLGFYGGLLLVAIGSGGIKPCVSAFAGDQFTAENKQLLPRLFAVFYWSINLGSFFASLLIPIIFGPKEHPRPQWAFGVPAVLMAVATVVFWAGRKHYVHPPPVPRNPHSFVRVMWDVIRGGGWAAAAQKHPKEALDGSRAVLKVVVVFLPVPFFWMLFDQKASTWVQQAQDMNLAIGPVTFSPAHMQVINPALVMLMIPFAQNVLYPAFERAGYPLKPLWRMTLGMFLAAVSFGLVALIQVQLDGGNKLSVLWQAAPYLFLTAAEVLVSVTGLEFAYRQAPLEMKGIITSFWLLTVTVGNLAVVLFKHLFETRLHSLLFFGGLTVASGVAMGIIASWYKGQEYIRGGSSA